MTKVVLVTGGFDPLHSGHIDYFNSAKKLGDELVVGLNSDEWLIRKKGKPFLPYQERIQIIQSLEMVDDIVSFDDSDNSSCGAIFKLLCTTAHDKKIIFANGGDRTAEDIPELTTYGAHPQVDFKFGVGGSEKKNSSSWILAKWPGEIIESDIIWYHNHLRSYRNRYLLETGAANPKARTLNTAESEIGEMMRRVISHEIGHALGLPHNMKASSA